MINGSRPDVPAGRAYGIFRNVIAAQGKNRGTFKLAEKRLAINGIGGKGFPIAVTASARLAEFPDLPTFKELGYDELTAVTWFALSGPAGLPNDVTQRLNAAVAKMLALPDVRKRLDRDAVETRVMTSDEFTAFVASEIDKWTPVARRVMPGN